MGKRKLFSFQSELRQRELGLRCYLGHNQQMEHALYSSISPAIGWDPVRQRFQAQSPMNYNAGGIFNLEFSFDGSIVVAACEKKVVAGFDPLTKKEIFKINDAHSDCVNGSRFLDSRIFATCSDDKTACLWDVRNLKEKIVRLEGHSNWVKNLDYLPSERMLLTSAFDGQIFGWRINECTEESIEPIEIFSVDRLMRSKLSTDKSKMILCTSRGFMVLIHNLDVNTLTEDYKAFNSRNPCHLKSNKRNRIEYITDFTNCAGLIHSIQVHPEDWCVISRNTTAGGVSEYTSVHDIQGVDESVSSILHINKDFCLEENEHNLSSDFFSLGVRIRRTGYELPRETLSVVEGNYYCRQSDGLLAMNPSGAMVPVPPITILPDVEEPRDETIERRYVRAHRTYDIPRNRSFASLSPMRLPPSNHQFNHFQQISNSREGYFVRSRPIIDARHMILMHSYPRLTNYTQEPNVGPGFIKELSLSNDGRVICSPFDCGVRLLTFDEQGAELAPKNTPKMLHTVSTIACHSESVVSTKFAPHSYLLVTGSLSGEMVWHYPVL